MADVATYNVRAKLRIDDSALKDVEARLRRIGRGTKILVEENRKVATSYNSIGRAFRAGVLAYLGYKTFQGLRAATNMIADVGMESENAISAIGGLLQSIQGVEFSASRRIAGGLFDSIRRDAAAGAGDLGAYLQTFQMLMSPGLSAGIGTDRLRKITKLGIGAGAVFRGQMGIQTAGMDLVQALTQGIGERTTPIVIAALRAAGMNADAGAFNKLSASERFDIIEEAFGSLGPAVEAYGKTFEAQSDSLKDATRNVVREMTSPAWDRMRRLLGDTNDRLDANADRLGEFQDGMGTVIGAMADATADLIDFGLDVAEGAADTGKMWEAAGKSAQRFLDTIQAGFGEDLGRGASGLAAAFTRGASIRFGQLSERIMGPIRGTDSGRLLELDIAQQRLEEAAGRYQAGEMGLREYFEFDPFAMPGDMYPEPEGVTGKEVVDTLQQIRDNQTKSRKLEVRARLNIKWGDDRQVVQSLENLLTDAIEQAGRHATSSGHGDLLPGML